MLLAIMHEEHEPITAVRAGVPLELDRIVAKALAKNPAERYQYVEDLLVDLRAITVQRDSGRFAASYASQKPRTRWLPWTAVSAALLATVGLTWWLTRFGEHAPVASPQFKLTQLTSDTGLTFEPSISTDGTRCPPCVRFDIPTAKRKMSGSGAQSPSPQLPQRCAIWQYQ